MKMNNIALATVLALGLGMSSFANAADQGSGTVTFTGSIIDAPCSIAPGSIDQTVNLGAVSNVALAANGNTGVSSEVPFSIKLEGCVVQPSPAAAPKVSVTFGGQASAYDAESLGMIGSAQGAYIRMSQADGAKVKLNVPTAEQAVISGNNNLNFTAALVGGGASATIVPGTFQVPTNFVLSYQ
ncbi:fimbrial protein [Aeromonas sp. s10]|uniref:fimbrial protein n=1 Tax=Aeromonas TaxID=642 RepID=UPI0034A39107